MGFFYCLNHYHWFRYWVIVMLMGLKCRECGERYKTSLRYICDECFGPLEINYDFEKIADAVKADYETGSIVSRSNYFNLFHYLPEHAISKNCFHGIETGKTPLVQAKNLGEKLGISDLYLKDEGASYPSLSFKDRVVASAIEKAMELSCELIACASTGNLANSMALHASSRSIKCVIFVPEGTNHRKVAPAISAGAKIFEVEGDYDAANRLCSELQEFLGWMVINGNLKPYYQEGAKSLVYEIMEEMEGNPPGAIVCPMGGGGLISMLWSGIIDMQRTGLLHADPPAMIGAQARACSPIIDTLNDKLENESENIKPVRSGTAISSISIGDPPDGIYAIRAIRESGGAGESTTDEEAISMSNMLAEEEGIITGGAGGVALSVAFKVSKSSGFKNKGPVVVILTDRGEQNEILAGGNKSGKVQKVKANLSSFLEQWK